MLPGTVYNYGPDAFPDLVESCAAASADAQGRDPRADGAAAARRRPTRGVRTLIVRAGDFFGPRAGNNWFSQGLVKPGQPLAAISDPGRRGVGHQWAYLPDVAETIVRLVERESALAVFDSFHMDGHWDADGTQMQAAIRRASGAAGRCRCKRFPWWLVDAGARPSCRCFASCARCATCGSSRCACAMRGCCRLLGTEPHTPLDVAVAATLAGLGCLRGGAEHPQHGEMRK